MMGNSCISMGNTNIPPPSPKDFVTAKKLETIKLMLSSKAITDIDITSEDDNNSWTCLMHQSFVGNQAAVEFLLFKHQPPANPNILGAPLLVGPRDSALLCAVKANEQIIVKLLLDAGADRAVVLDDRYNMNVLKIAKSDPYLKEYKRCIELLENYFPETIKSFSVAKEATRKQEDAKWKDKIAKEREEEKNALTEKNNEAKALRQASILLQLDAEKKVAQERADLEIQELRVKILPIGSLSIDDEKSCELGVGSHGKVVKAKLTDTNISIDVAVKVIIPKAGHNADYKLKEIFDTCKGEVEALKEIQSKVGFKDQGKDKMIEVIGVAIGELPVSFEKTFGKKEKAVAIVMRLENGGSLLSLLKSPKIKNFGVVQKLGLLLQLSNCLAVFHNADIAHGGVKSCNIFLTDHSPPFVRLGDFGRHTMKSNKSIDISILGGLSKAQDMPRYDAPEMLLIGSSSGKRADPSCETDVYSFGLVCYEVLCKDHKIPFQGLTTESELIEEVGKKGMRPDLAVDIQADVPESMKTLIAECWSSDRKTRPSAFDCNKRIGSCYKILNSSSYDIFLSHLWNEKHYVKYVKKFLNTVGYNVWYDMDHMDHKLVDSMKRGIDNSKVFLVCIHRNYEPSRNCMLELDHATSEGKPIVVLLTDKGAWDSKNSDGSIKEKGWASQGIIDKIGLHSQGSLFVDISEICASSDWKPPSKDVDYEPPIKLKQDLYTKLEELVALLRKPQIDCIPSL